MTQKFNLSANIEEGFFEESQYIVTPNTRRVVEGVVNGFQSGIHSYTIIGSYGTGKSSFLLALERDLKEKDGRHILLNPSTLSDKTFEVLKVVGDYKDLSTLLGEKLSTQRTSDDVLSALRNKYKALKERDTFLVILIDEFGKVLEHAAKNAPERELYFMQKLAEFVNVPTRNILLITTLHQNFSAYSRRLSVTQKEEWTKVKGRFQELVFVEPIEQLLYLAANKVEGKAHSKYQKNAIGALAQLAKTTGFISSKITSDIAYSLAPLESFAAYAITQAIQRYGQNERSLFSFLKAKGEKSLLEYKRDIYNLACAYDYTYYNFYSYLKEANADSMQWSVMQISIERAEGLSWGGETDLIDAIKFVKAIGLLNLFGNASFRMNRQELITYGEIALGVNHADEILKQLEQFKIIRYAVYKGRYLLFEGTDINIEEEVRKAGLVVNRPQDIAYDIKKYCFKKVAPVKACYYQKGTPRYFEYEVLDRGFDKEPMGDTDGFIQLIFSPNEESAEVTRQLSAQCTNAIIFACFSNTDELTDHLYQIEKYKYILDKVLVDQSDKVAISEINKLIDFEKITLNKIINESLFAYGKNVTWLYKGEKQPVHSLKGFNQLLSVVCKEVYSLPPVINNELFNKQKLSSSISSAKGKFLSAMLQHSDEVDFGLASNKFPPEKTIYYSLLKTTGLHMSGAFRSTPTTEGIMPLWNACESFLTSTTNKAKKISELIKILSAKPYKLKQGVLDFWVPIYLYIKRQDYSLYGANGAYIPSLNMEFFELLQKHPEEYLIKAFDVSGVKVEIFNQYRKFLNAEELDSIKSDDFIETIKPFFFFYNKRLNEYAKHTRKFDHIQTIRFRDTLARAKDPEKTFFEDLPAALGYDKEMLLNSEKVQEFCNVINRAVRELRSCYTDMIDRVENRLLETLGIEDYDYEKYVAIIRDRLSPVKVYLLTGRLKEFYQHAMTEFENRTEWYQSICYIALEQPLERLRDDQEEKLINDLITLFIECEKYADISRVAKNEKDEVFSFDLVSTMGKDIHAQTFRLPDSEKRLADNLEKDIDILLSKVPNDNISVCALLKVLNKKLGK